MKRHGNIFSKIITIDNLRLAHINARKGKTHYSEVQRVDKNPDYFLYKIQEMLLNKTYTTSEYNVFTIIDKGKEREIYKLPFYPDRIIHWAIMQQIECIFLNTFIDQTYAALPNKGTHRALYQMDEYMKKDKNGTQYCLKIDIKKFFPNIDQETLKKMVRMKFKDKDLLWLLNDIISSSDSGIPIGNYLSQYFGNFYLAYFDHWLKEEKGIRYYLRYMDDCVILHHDKDFLHQLKREMDEYLDVKLKLTIKGNWQVFPTYVRGVDYVGYRHFGDYILLRKSTAKNFKRKMGRILKRCEDDIEMTYSEWCSINSYKGWIMHCDGYNLTEKYIKPLLPYAKNYYKEVIKNDSNRIRMESSR
ncbi:reverse transcriptase [Psychrobacillus phage Perkons]|nr:reverse transcriptase [Psychrobacillus phage Perkons]